MRPMREIADDSDYFFKLLAVFALAAVVALVGWIMLRRPSTVVRAYPFSNQPRVSVHTVAFMPGQYADIRNNEYRKIEIHSTYPIRVLSGTCNLQYGVEFYCDSTPADIFITDMRPKPIFSTPTANTITITAAEF